MALFSIATDFAHRHRVGDCQLDGVLRAWLQTQHALAMSTTRRRQRQARCSGAVTALGNMGGLLAMVLMAVGFQRYGWFDFAAQRLLSARVGGSSRLRVAIVLPFPI
jgi:hypothetical protein